jgi:hypothetical protein
VAHDPGEARDVRQPAPGDDPLRSLHLAPRHQTGRAA